jgi:preprotein translocase subunit SecD
VEGIYWFRISSVLALTLGSIWVLLPTFLDTGAEERLAGAASGVATPGKSRADLAFTLPIVSGDPEPLAEALEQRFAAAGVAVDSVTADGVNLVVKVEPGTSEQVAAALAQRVGNTALHPLSALAAPPVVDPAAPLVAPEGPLAAVLSVLPPAEVAWWANALPKLGGVGIPAGAAVLPGRIDTAARTDAGVVLSLTPPAEALGAELVAVVEMDSRVAGLALPDGRFFPLGDDPTVVPVLLAGPLPGSVSAPIADKTAPEQQEAPDEVAAEIPWYAKFLGPWKISRGLDIQGGIDLTLQVELDEAVLGQVSRDMAYIKEGAAKEGIVLDGIRRAHGSPILELTTAAPLADVQAFLRGRSNDYVYLDSEGSTHRFELGENAQEEVRTQAVEQVLDTLRKRVDATGVKEPTIAKKGGGRIEVQLPGLADVQGAVDTIGTTAILEFRMVDEEFDESVLDQVLSAARTALPPEQYADDMILNEWLWAQGRLPEDRLVLWTYSKEKGKEDERAQPFPVRNEIPLTGNDVNNASVGWDQQQQPYVRLEFKPRGGQIFCDLTTESVGKRFAIVLDQRVQSAPSIREKICGGQASIEMSSADDPLKDAQTLAIVLRTGALDAPVVVASVRHVGASLGQDAIRSGTTGAVVGSLLVAGFMILWYRTSGVVANLALVVNVLMILAALAMFGATLTLPGIAGIALTVGMAVDANIVVYERIREELRLGVQARKAVDAGFEKALVAIVDSNITTAIAGIVMYSYGTGPLKGFAVTLLIGIATTLVTAVFVTRTIMDVLTRSSSARLRI